jgi:hypothetical protein
VLATTTRGEGGQHQAGRLSDDRRHGPGLPCRRRGRGGERPRRRRDRARPPWCWRRTSGGRRQRVSRFPKMTRGVAPPRGSTLNKWVKAAGRLQESGRLPMTKRLEPAEEDRQRRNRERER